MSSSAYARAYPPRSSRRRIFFNHRDDPFRGPHIGAGESSDTRDGERRRTSFRRKMQWTYVAYLGGLDALLLRRDPGGAIGNGGGAIREPRWEALLSVGFFAGLSSGFIGIGGGLATTVGLSAVLDVPQRQAQMASLVLSLIPTTIPAAGVYWRAGAMGPWPALLAVILGLVAGTDLGRGSALGSEAGRFARRCSPSSRRWRHTWRAKRGSPLERITQSRCSCIVRE